MDPRGIEPLPRQCECRVMPLYYGPLPVGVPGIEPGLYAPEAHVLPVYYTPIIIFIVSSPSQLKYLFFILMSKKP